MCHTSMCHRVLCVTVSVCSSDSLLCPCLRVLVPVRLQILCARFIHVSMSHRVFVSKCLCVALIPWCLQIKIWGMPAINNNDTDDDDDDFYSAPSRLGSKKKTVGTFSSSTESSLNIWCGSSSQSTAAKSFNPCTIIASIALDPFIPLLIMFTL